MYNLLNVLIEEYSNNIILYQRNVEKILNILTLLQNNYPNEMNDNYLRSNSANINNIFRPSPIFRPTGNYRRNHLNGDETNASLYYPSRYIDLIYEFHMNNDDNQELLTREQIDSSIESIEYNETLNESRCPISLEDFQVGQTISRIKYCGHIFKTQNLMNWLNRHNCCPVCRYNLHNYTENNNTSSVNNNNNDDTTIDNLLNEITDSFDFDNEENL